MCCKRNSFFSVLIPGLVLSVLLCIPVSALEEIKGPPGPVQIAKEIRENTTLAAGGGPYVIQDTVIVAEGVTLTIEEGCDIQFEKTGSLVVFGTVMAKGTGTIFLKEVDLKDGDVQKALKRLKGNLDIASVMPFRKKLADIRREYLSELKKELSFCLLKSNSAKAQAIADTMEELFPQDFHDNADLMVYVYFIAGNAKKAQDILNKGGVKTGPYLTECFGADGKKNETAKVCAQFVDVKIQVFGNKEELEQTGLKKAYWRAVKLFIDETYVALDNDTRANLNDKAQCKASEYIVTTIPFLAQASDARFDASYLVFLNREKLQKDLNTPINAAFEKSLLYGVADCAVSTSKKMFLNSLKTSGILHEDMGSGSCDPANLYEKAQAKEIDVVVIIKETAAVSPSKLGGNMKSINGMLDIKGYDVYTKSPVLNIVQNQSQFHSSEEQGREMAFSNAFTAIEEKLKNSISELNRQLMADEQRQIIKRSLYAEKHLPPMEVKVLKTEPVFSNNYKVYGEKPFIEIQLNNNTSRDFEQVKVDLMIKEFMDFPTGIKVDKLKAMGNVKLQLTGVFNNRVLELTESSPVQADIRVKYFKEGEEKTISSAHTVQIYEKHSLTWDDIRKIAIFVTPKERTVMDFSRHVILKSKTNVIHQNITAAVAIFEAVRSLGTTYRIDPNSPYQTMSNKEDAIDYIQYARETLKRKTGDCDDLVVLFASLMESLGVKTAAIDYPGHILAMFDTGIAMENIEKAGIAQDEAVSYEGRAWIPVELTLLKENFNKAWRLGMKNYSDNVNNHIRIIPMEKAWIDYKPPTLPEEKIDIAVPDLFAGRFKASLDELIARRNEKLLDFVKKGVITPESSLFELFSAGNQDDGSGLVQYMMNHGIDTAEFYNDAGNICFIKKQYEKAAGYYKKAMQKDPENPFYIGNCIKAEKKLGNKAEVNTLTEKLKILAPYMLED